MNVFFAFGQKRWVNGVSSKPLTKFWIQNAQVYLGLQKGYKQIDFFVSEGKISFKRPSASDLLKYKIVQASGLFAYPGFIDLSSQFGIAHFSPTEGHNNNVFESKEKGNTYWNDAIRVHQHAHQVLQYSEEDLKKWYEMGYTNLQTYIPNGIYRGTSTFLHAMPTVQEAILLPTSARFFSFQKGQSAQVYPSSLTGSVALFRQFMYDEKWSLLNPSKALPGCGLMPQNLPDFFEISQVNDYYRLQTLEKEFGFKPIVVSKQADYECLDTAYFKGKSMVVQLYEVEPLKVDFSWDYERASIRKLLQWTWNQHRLAFLLRNQAKVALSVSGLENEQVKAHFESLIQSGVTRNQLIESCTRIPASFLGAEKSLGTIGEGYWANFSLSTDTIFKKGSQTYAVWVKGTLQYQKDTIDEEMSGVYRLKIDQDTFRVKLKSQFHKIQLLENVYKDTANSISKVSGLFPRLRFHVRKNAYELAYQGNGTWVGVSSNAMNLQMKKISKYPTDTHQVQKLNPKQSHTERIWPMQAYGNNSRVIQKDVLFKSATLITAGKQGRITETDLLISNGKIKNIGKNLNLPPNTLLIDAKGKFITPGFWDEHSHVAIDGGVNECSYAITSEVRMSDVLDPTDINLYRNLAGGVVGAQILHGSCNAIGGQSAIIKFKWGQTPEAMKVSYAKPFIKFALGENVKQSNWGEAYRNRFPQTRMGVQALYADAFTRAKQYLEQKRKGKLQPVDLQLEALAEILEGKRKITCHAYIQSEMEALIKTGKEYGFTVNTFTHALEAYKIASILKKENVGASTFADWWAYKMEVKDAIPYNTAMLTRAEVVTAVNSDDAEMARRLNHEAAKSIKYGGLTPDEAIQAITIQPAKLLGINERTGSIEIGKDADLAIWDAEPMSVYAKCMQTWIEGACYFDRVQYQKQKEAQTLLKEKILKSIQESGIESNRFTENITEPSILWECEDQ